MKKVECRYIHWIYFIIFKAQHPWEEWISYLLWSVVQEMNKYFIRSKRKFLSGIMKPIDYVVEIYVKHVSKKGYRYGMRYTC